MGESRKIARAISAGTDLASRLSVDKGGYPITGDDLYGIPSPLIGRHALHAYALRFPHPVSGEYITVIAPPANDFLQLCHAAFPALSLEEQLEKERIFS